MVVEDPVLPAAAHLTGARAHRVLAAAVGAAGGTLQQARACHLHYRPGREVVVRFHSSVRWGGADPVVETLLAATHASGPPPGTLPVEATTADGDRLAVGVWRWPFDPVLRGLEDAVTPSRAAAFLDGAVQGRLHIEVVAYRPTQRAVARAVDGDGTVLYLKAVPPADVGELVDRHRRLGAAGVPVPTIVRHDARRGLIAMTALHGPTVRDRIKRGQRCLPDPDQYEELYRRFAAARLAGRRVPNRSRGSLYHAAMLASVLPGQRPRLERLTDLLTPAAQRADERVGPTVHGDLYEAQLVTGRGRWRARTIAGVLDLDDAGPGDPLDDRATVIAHLVDRVVDGDRPASDPLTAYLRTLRAAFAEQVDAAELDLTIAGVLVGLATGPFRVQQRRWQAAVRRRLAVAERLATNPGDPRWTVGR